MSRANRAWRGYGRSVLVKILRTYLRPYGRAIGLVVFFQLVQVIANLYLPRLNADIIDNGVVMGDTDYILRIGAIMLVVTLVQIACAIAAVYFGARTAMALGRDLRAASSTRCESLRRAGGRSVRRPVADHPHDQRRPAGPDARAADVHDDGLRADHVHRRHRSWRCARTCRSRCSCWSSSPCSSAVVGLIIRRMRPLFRTMQVRIDSDQPDHARADHRHPRHPRLRARRARAEAASTRRNDELIDVSLRGRQADGVHVPDRHAGHERVERGGAVVRWPPHRRRGACRSARSRRS